MENITVIACASNQLIGKSASTVASVIKLTSLILLGVRNPVLCLSRIADLEAQLKDDITSAKSQYESELVLNFSYSDSSKVFKYIKSATKQSILPQVMSLDTSSAHTDEEKAELFNKFFFSVYSNNSNEAFTPVTNSLPTLDDIVFDVSEVFRILASLDTTKAMSIDGIGPLVLKSCADVLCVPIHHLFTVSLSSGYIPLTSNISSSNFYFNRFPRLWNSLPSVDDDVSTSVVISRLKALFWSHFLLNFNNDDPCSYHFLCPCSSCAYSSPNFTYL